MPPPPPKPSDPATVKKFANHVDLQTFLTANPTIILDKLTAWHGFILVYETGGAATTWYVAKFANHVDLQTFLSLPANANITIDFLVAWMGLILVYH